jgi:hypothetical protein
MTGGTLTGYTATASAGSQASCSTTSATNCTITGLTNGTTYSVTVVAHSLAGDSGQSAPVLVTPANPVAITSPAGYTATFGAAFSFTVTATGSPPPTITEAGKLPPGVSFTAYGDGTAAITGIPRGRSGRAYLLTLTATNGSGTATQAFTLTIAKAPR